MISIHVDDGRRSSSPLVLAIFSFRYDAHLVPDLLANIRPLVDGWVSYDDRGAGDIFSDEPARRQALVVAAQQAGADWIMPIDPDERFERGLAEAMPELTAAQGLVAYSFPVRELFTPDAYRVDGIWGRKRQSRLIRMPQQIAPSPMPLHSPWQAIAHGADLRVVDFNLYHLKMITPQRRMARRDLYKHLDPDRRFQSMGYDYLSDESGMTLERIPEGRAYDPDFVEDHGLWMPDVSRV